MSETQFNDGVQTDRWRNADLDVSATISRFAGFVPVTVGVVAVISWYLASIGARFTELFAMHILNPFLYLAGMLFHESWAHFTGNLRWLLLFGVLLTWLTSNRHVFGVIVVAEFLSQLISTAIGQPGIGLSGTVFALAAALLVRATGIAMGDASSDTLSAAITGVFTPVAVGFLVVAILLGGDSRIAHFSHFFGLLFGGAIEAVYVLSEADSRD